MSTLISIVGFLFLLGIMAALLGGAISGIGSFFNSSTKTANNYNSPLLAVDHTKEQVPAYPLYQYKKAEVIKLEHIESEEKYRIIVLTYEDEFQFFIDKETFNTLSRKQVITFEAIGEDIHIFEITDKPDSIRKSLQNYQLGEILKGTVDDKVILHENNGDKRYFFYIKNWRWGESKFLSIPERYESPSITPWENIRKGDNVVFRCFNHNIDVKLISEVLKAEPTEDSHDGHNVRYLDPSKHQKEMIKKAGEEGEKEVAYALSWLNLTDKKYIIYNNISLVFNDVPQQFDHLVIGPNGIFNLETKYYAGKITIDEHGHWYREKDGVETGLESPLAQVQRHRKILQAILKKDYPIVDVVVLAHKECIAVGLEHSPIKVCKTDTLAYFIENYQPEKPLSEDDVKEVLKNIEIASN